MSCGEGGPSPNMPVGEARRKKPHDLSGSQLVSDCPLPKFKQQARGSEMPANLTHVVSRVGVQPDWNSVVLSHFGRVRCFCLGT